MVEIFTSSYKTGKMQKEACSHPRSHAKRALRKRPRVLPKACRGQGGPMLREMEQAVHREGSRWVGRPLRL